MGEIKAKFKHQMCTSQTPAPDSDKMTRILHVKEMAHEECFRNFFILQANIEAIELFSGDNFFEPYLARLKDMGRFMKTQTNICLDTGLQDLSRIIARILQFGERHDVLGQMLAGTTWNPLVPKALEILLGDCMLTENYLYISDKLR